MAERDHLLLLAKKAVRNALMTLENMGAREKDYRFADDLPREMKAGADRLVEVEILNSLIPSGIPILSEEAGTLEGESADLRWVVDPLDGTVNYVRGIAPCAVSVALCRDGVPIFGVIGEYPTLKIAWGGASIGTFVEGCSVNVSKIADKDQAILCTGFPSRFDFDGEAALRFIDRMSAYCKIRMLGAASLSLLQVAKGSADAYAEQDIMFWDVAAGLALVEGSGGNVNVSAGGFENSLNIFASNGLLDPD